MSEMSRIEPPDVGLLCRAMECVCPDGQGHNDPRWKVYEEAARRLESELAERVGAGESEQVTVSGYWDPTVQEALQQDADQMRAADAAMTPEVTAYIESPLRPAYSEQFTVHDDLYQDSKIPGLAERIGEVLRTDADRRAEALARAVEAHEQNRHVEDSEDLWENVRSCLISWQAVADRPGGREPLQQAPMPKATARERVAELAAQQDEESRRVEIELAAMRAGSGTVKVYGQDISSIVQRGDLFFGAREIPRLSLSLFPKHGATVSADGADVALDEMTQTFLRRLGWTAPDEPERVALLQAVAETSAELLRLGLQDDGSPEMSRRGQEAVSAMVRAMVAAGVLDDEMARAALQEVTEWEAERGEGGHDGTETTG